MRNSLFLVLGAGLLLAAGCSKKSDSPTPAPTTGDSTLTATVSGAADFTASDASSGQYVGGFRGTSSDPNEAPYVLTIRANMGDRQLFLHANKFTGPGTYPLKVNAGGQTETGHAFYGENGSSGPLYTTVNLTPVGTVGGQLVVTSYDVASQHIQGTFSFTGASSAGGPTKQVSSGKFDIYTFLTFN